MPENDGAISEMTREREALLKRLKAVEQLSEFVGMAPGDAAEGLPLLSRQVRELERDIERHARKEEQGLFSLLIEAEEDRGSELLIPLVTEHCDLENRCGELRKALDHLEADPGESRHWQVLKILGLIRGLSELLRDHLETELQKLFPRLSRLLDPAEIAWAGEQMRWLGNRE